MGDIDQSGSQALAHNIQASKHTDERILSIQHWSPTVLSFRTTRNLNFRFTAGHYARLGLPAAEQGSWVFRPYSVVSPTSADYLEFLVVLIPGGAFSQLLENVRVGSVIRIEKLAYGFLTLDRLAAGRDLWLIASGTGVGPFLSILHEPAAWQQYQRLILVHSVRHSAELAYRKQIQALPPNELLPGANAQLTYVPIVTRDPGATTLSKRIPELLADGQLEAAVVPIDVTHSRMMICGNPELAAALRSQLQDRGFATGRRGVAGQMAFEQYW